MGIHFGGPLTEFKLHPQRFQLIRQTIKDLGYDLSRDWIIEEEDGKTIPETKMFEKTLKAIESSNAVILENSQSSTSVGQQMMLAIERNIPVLRLRYKGSIKPKGVFLTKKMSKLVDEKFYTDETISRVLKNFLDKSIKKFGTARFNLALERELDNHLKYKAKINNSSKTEEVKKLILADMRKPKKKANSE